MTVNTTKITSGPYVGNGVASTFSYTFKVDDKTQLSVYETTDLGVETLLTVDTDYTVAGVGTDGGGILTRVAGALPTDYQWYIRSNYIETQLTAFGSQGPFFPEIHEEAADKLTFLIQQLLDRNDRSPRVSDSYRGDIPLSLDNPQAGYMLRWNGDLTGLENVEFITDPSVLGGNELIIFPNVAAMKASTSAALVSGINILTQGYYSPGDGGGCSYIAAGTQTVDSFGDHTLDNGNVALLVIKDGVFNVVEFGAVGDDVTDDYLPIQAANVAAVEYSNANLGGATILYPPFSYFITGTVSPLPAGENTLDRYNDNQNDIAVGRVENIEIRGYGTRIRSEFATFVPSFPFCMMTTIFAPHCSVKGIVFESDMNDKIPNWFDSSNYFNRSVPTVKGEYGFVAIRSNNLKVIDNYFHHCEVGLTITDDRDTTHPSNDEMLNYKTEVRGNHIYNCWTGLSTSGGSTEEMIVSNNHFEYTFLKLAQGTDQERGILFTNNTGRDVSGILMAASDVRFSGNIFNNLLGGFSLQPGGTGNLAFTYEIRNFKLTGSICYSDHMTEVNGESIGAGTARPQGFVTFNAAASATGAQTVSITNFKCDDNNVDLWPLAGNSTGAFMLRTGTAEMEFDSPVVTNNVCIVHNNLGALVTMAPEAAFSTTSFTGTFKFNDNKFTRKIAGNTAFDFQFMSGTFNDQAVLEFNGNDLRTLGVNRQVVVGNFNKLIAKDNTFFTDSTGESSTNASFWTRSVPKIEIDQNELGKINSASNLGYILYFDGIVSGVYDTVLDTAVVRLEQNRVTSAASTFSTPLTFPASSHGLYEFDGNIVRNALNAVSGDYPTNASFTAENIVNPARVAPSAIDVSLPVGYTVRPFSAVGPTGWLWTGSWTAMPPF